MVVLSTATRLRCLRLPTEGWDLERLSQNCPWCERVYDWLGAIFRHPQVRQDFTHLRELVITSSVSDLAAPYAEIWPMLFLPALKRFQCFGLDGDLRDTCALQPSISLEEIVLSDADLPLEAVRDVLSHAAALKVFEVHFDRDEGQRQDLSCLMPLLQHHKTRLEVLGLTNVPQHGWLFEGEPALGSLVDFTKLKTLILDDALVRGRSNWPIKMANILPTKLECLIILINGGPLEAGMGRICASFEAYENVNCAKFRLSFSKDSGPDDFEDLPEYRLSENEIASFSYDEAWGDDDRIGFTCRGTNIGHKLAAFAELISENHEIVPYMLENGEALTLDEDGSVYVKGCGNIWDIVPKEKKVIIQIERTRE